MKLILMELSHQETEYAIRRIAGRTLFLIRRRISSLHRKVDRLTLDIERFRTHLMHPHGRRNL